MAENVSLSAAVRANLLALQSTTDLIARTQGRLSTGLRVAAAVDDPVSFFQAKSLADRADDFTVKKRSIDQGVSTLTAASDAVTGIDALVQQLKGLVQTAKSATTATEVSDLVSQFNDLRTQINNLASDATYQGLNLVNATGQTLTVNFSNDTASVLNVNSYDLRSSRLGLDIAKLSAASSTDLLFNRTYISAGTISGAALGLGLTSAGGTNGGASEASAIVSANTISVTVAGQTANTISAGDSVTLYYDGLTFTVDVVATRTEATALGGTATYITAGTYAVGSSVVFNLITGFFSGASALTGYSNQTAGTGYSAGANHISTLSGPFIRLTGTSISVTESEATRVSGVGFTTEYNSRITNLDAGLTTLRSRAQTLGSNIALLQTRLDFTKAYVSTLTTGAGKLTLADLNEEGANLLALQTRQQLGIQSLAFAGQAEQTILTLFR
ncbi:MAG: flagellin-like protein [Rhodospirillales bacterium]|nr:flagellin-like protein [Rhodospirillales bacterium]